MLIHRQFPNVPFGEAKEVKKHSISDKLPLNMIMNFISILEVLFDVFTYNLLVHK